MLERPAVAIERCLLDAQHGAAFLDLEQLGIRRRAATACIAGSRSVGTMPYLSVRVS